LNPSADGFGTIKDPKGPRQPGSLAVLDDYTDASWFAYSIEVPWSIP
jgi:hypothetical protein